MHTTAVTIDVDWAPDWAMRDLAEALVSAGIPSTWFITHPTPVLDELRQHSGLVELGVHPNFLPASSHGADPESVLRSCMDMVPEARTMRTHCLVQSTPILQTVVDVTPISVDTSIYLRDAVGVEPSPLPLDGGRTLTRYPYVWEDDLEFFAEEPRWDGLAFLEERGRADEITIIDVHPIHYALNSADIRPYRAFKSAHPDLRAADQRDAEGFRFDGTGARSFIDSLADARQRLDVDFHTLSSLDRSRSAVSAQEEQNR